MSDFDNMNLVGSMVKVIFNNGTNCEGKVLEWNNDGCSYLETEDKHLLVIHKTNENVMLVKIYTSWQEFVKDEPGEDENDFVPERNITGVSQILQGQKQPLKHTSWYVDPKALIEEVPLKLEVPTQNHDDRLLKLAELKAKQKQEMEKKLSKTFTPQSVKVPNYGNPKK